MKAPPGARDTKKWCEFHTDHGHRTDECHALRLEVAELLKQGHLKDFLTERGKATRNKTPNDTKDNQPIPPRHNKVINVISDGLEVSGVSYAAAKRSSRCMVRADLRKSGAHDPDTLQIINF